MKKAICFTIFCAVLMIISPLAYGGEGGFVSANFGMALRSEADVTSFDGNHYDITKTQFDNGVAWGVGFGYDYGTSFKIEAEIASQENDFSQGTVASAILPGFPNGVSGGFSLTGKASHTAVLINGYYDFLDIDPFALFVTAGIGFAEIEVEHLNILGMGTPDLTAEDLVIIGHIGAGMVYDISEKIKIDIKYRYFVSQNQSFAFIGTEYTSFNVSAGLRYYF